MKKVFSLFVLLMLLLAQGAFAQSKVTLIVWTNGPLAAPTNFLASNIFGAGGLVVLPAFNGQNWGGVVLSNTAILIQGGFGNLTTLTNGTAVSSDTNISFYIGTNGFNLGGNGDVNASGTVTASDATFVSQYINNGTNLDTTTVLSPLGYARANITGDGIVNLLDRRLITQVASSVSTISNAHWLGKWIKGKAISYDLSSRVGVGTGNRDAFAWLEVSCDPGTNYAFMVNTNWLVVTNGLVGIGTAIPAFTLDVVGTERVSNGFILGASGSTITNILAASATLDFPSTGSGAVSDLPITVTGAASGDVVEVGVPQPSATGIIGSFSGFASNNTVFVRFLSTAAAQDPISGTFKVIVTKF